MMHGLKNEEKAKTVSDYLIKQDILKAEMHECIESIFGGTEDPEVIWKEFRYHLKKIKDRHIAY